MYNNLKTRKESFPSLAEWWEEVKKQTKLFFRKQSMIKSKEKFQKFDEIQQRMITLENLERGGMEVGEEREKTKTELKEWLKQRGKEHIFNSRVKIFEEDEKCSRFFFKKAQQVQKVMNELKDTNGQTQKGTEKVGKITTAFFPNCTKKSHQI